MSQNLGNILREAGVKLPEHKKVGPLIGPMRPSMEHRIIISRLRRQIKEEKENGQSQVPGGSQLSVSEPDPYQT